MKDITFKRTHIEWAGCVIVLITFIIVLGLTYYVFLYTPTITYEPYETPKETTK